jgi:mannose-6-phosphate isomerase-like protein (cupin superfamily)
MPNYTIKNFKELPDSAAERPGDVEARFGRSHIDSDHLGVSYFRYGPGFRSPVAHRHREQEEAYVVVSGSGRVKLDDDVHELKLWDVIRVSPTVARAFEGGPNGIEIVAIGADRPEGGDGEMIPDFWTE